MKFAKSVGLVVVAMLACTAQSRADDVCMSRPAAAPIHMSMRSVLSIGQSRVSQACMADAIQSHRVEGLARQYSPVQTCAATFAVGWVSAGWQ